MTGHNPLLPTKLKTKHTLCDSVVRAVSLKIIINMFCPPTKSFSCYMSSSQSHRGRG
jgi:hypothetical protein